ncbi:DUF4328 domain-containing protein [Streptomyces sp. ISL-11]|uniref:DUF4328 domain-containing protein n=1 Tax=Streptomyces sp. ISL-11 TaxID=2819174 RepID=UPI0027E53E43|nr:DUF4328 domain-containing protein [Streptomyces sp. ISL-11]
MLLALVTVTDLFAVYAGFNIYALLEDVRSVSDRALDRGDNLYALAGVLQVVGNLAAAVVFIIWFHRVRTNADHFAQDMCTMGKGWAIGAWFVPVGNLWLPYRVATQTWDASAQSAPDGARREISRTPVRTWWALWIVALLIGRIGSTLYGRAETPHTLQQAAGIVIASDLMDIAAAVLAIVFVRKLSRMQQVGTGMPEPVAGR